MSFCAHQEKTQVTATLVSHMTILQRWLCAVFPPFALKPLGRDRNSDARISPNLQMRSMVECDIQGSRLIQSLRNSALRNDRQIRQPICKSQPMRCQIFTFCEGFKLGVPRKSSLFGYGQWTCYLSRLGTKNHTRSNAPDIMFDGSTR